jgi:hypothetical protein
VVVGISHRAAIGPRGGGLLAAVVTGLADHALALGIGYAGCLLCLAVRDRSLHAR